MSTITTATIITSLFTLTIFIFIVVYLFKDDGLWGKVDVYIFVVQGFSR